MHTRNVISRTLLAAALVSSAVSAEARGQGQSLLVSTSQDSKGVYGELYVGGLAWGSTTSLITSTFAGRLGTTSTLLDLTLMMQYDALWVDQRYQSGPSTAELKNLVDYANTGRRVVIVGENATWGSWNPAVLSAFGGAESLGLPPSGPGTSTSYGYPSFPGCAYGSARAVGPHPLLRGVERINLECAGAAVGGRALFDYNVATLWGPRQNVLTILDANILDDPFGRGFDGRAFRENVVRWVDSPSVLATPEPSTVLLLGAGLAALGTATRRRRRTSV